MKIKQILFMIIIGAQFMVSGSVISRYESILNKGKLFRFRTAPVDPYDPFRGRYVFLSMEEETLNFAITSEITDFASNQNVYALLSSDAQGFSVITDLRKDPPESEDYLKVKYLWSWKNKKKGDQINIQMPFKRFYMNEKLAPGAEAAYRSNSRREKKDAYAAVRIKDGLAVIEDLYIEGIPVADYVRNQK